MGEKSEEKATIYKRLKYRESNSFSVDKVDGAMLSCSNSKYVVSFFNERPISPEYSNMEIEADTGRILNEEMITDGDFVDFERVLTSAIETDLSTLKSITTMLINAIAKAEKK